MPDVRSEGSLWWTIRVSCLTQRGQQRRRQRHQRANSEATDEAETDARGGGGGSFFKVLPELLDDAADPREVQKTRILNLLWGRGGSNQGSSGCDRVPQCATRCNITAEVQCRVCQCFTAFSADCENRRASWHARGRRFNSVILHLM